MKIVAIITLLLTILNSKCSIQSNNTGVLISSDNHGYYLEYAEIFE